MIPEGYEKLAAIGIAYKGVYTEGSTYGSLNAVYYGGSTYVSLRDNPAGPPTADNVNWQYLAKGFLEGLLEAIDAVDTSGLIGTAGATVDAQNLLDVIADKVATKLIPYANLINNGLCTEAGKFPLDAAFGKKLQDLLDQLNRDLPQGKAGRFTCSLATGVSYTYHVTFTNPFPDTNYVITLSVNTSNFTYYIANRTVNGFDVIVYANSETSGGSFDWSAVRW